MNTRRPLAIIAIVLAFSLLIGCQSADPYDELSELLLDAIMVDGGEIEAGMTYRDDETDFTLDASGGVDSAGNMDLDIGLYALLPAGEAEMQIPLTIVDETAYVDITSAAGQLGGLLETADLPPVALPMGVGEAEPVENPYEEDLYRMLLELGDASGDLLRDSAAVTESGGVYTLTMDAELLAALSQALLDEYEENLDAYAQVFADYLFFRLEQLEGSLSDLETPLDGLDLFPDGLDGIEDAPIETGEVFGQAREMLEGLGNRDSEITLTISGGGDTYTLGFSVTSGDRYLSFTYSITECDVEITPPEDYIGIDEYSDRLLQALEDVITDFFGTFSFGNIDGAGILSGILDRWDGELPEVNLPDVELPDVELPEGILSRAAERIGI